MKLPSLEPHVGRESFGERLGRIRREKRISQVELAKKTGLIQTLVSDYERDKLRLKADMVVRFALALGVSTDELLGLKVSTTKWSLPRRKLLRRMERIEKLPPNRLSAFLRTIDALLAQQQG